MFKVFIAESALKLVVLSENAKSKTSQSSLYKILRQLKKLFVSKESEDTSWSQEYKEKYGLSLDFSKSDYIKDIPAHPETVLQHPSSVFILNIRDHSIYCYALNGKHMKKCTGINNRLLK